MEEKKPIARRKKHKNSRLGCPQCKQRRIKCDESLPSCQKCLDRDTRCGYLDLSPEAIAVITKAHSDEQALQRSGGAKPMDLPYSVSVTEEYYPLMPQYVRYPDPDTQKHHYPQSMKVQLAKHAEPQSTASEGSSSNPNGSSPATELSPPDQQVLLSEQLSRLLSTSAGASESGQSTPALQEQGYRTDVHTTGTSTTLSLMPHTAEMPKFDPKRFAEYFDETMMGVITRVYLRKDYVERFLVAAYNQGIFDVMMLFGQGRLVSYVPEAESYFLALRGATMRLLIKGLNDITDANARTMLLLASSLTRTSIHMKSQSFAEYQMLSNGPAAIILKGFENPTDFPSALAAMQRYADGMLVMYHGLSCPSYDPEVLAEFLEVVTEFGDTYIHNEDLYDSDDPLVKSLDNLIDYIKFILDMSRNHKSDEYVLDYPVPKLFELLKRWYDLCPSMSFTINSKMPHIEKVYYAFWHCLSFILESCFYNCRYFFTYLCNGYYETFVMPTDVVLDGLNQNLTWYANYNFRMMAFLNRRRKYLFHFCLSDKASISSNPQKNGKLKRNPLGIQEEFITKFKTTVIKAHHYPRLPQVHYQSSESPSDPTVASLMIDQFQFLSHSAQEETVDMYDINPKTFLLNNDYDPRFTDPIFELRWNIHSCDIPALNEFQEYKKEILKEESIFV